MKKQEILDGNKLIGFFMGAKKYWLNDNLLLYPAFEQPPTVSRNATTTYGVKELLYHSSWDWMMPVVEKIHMDRRVKEIVVRPGKTKIWFNDKVQKGYIESPYLPENTSIVECWIACIEFIKWHNEQLSPRELEK